MRSLILVAVCVFAFSCTGNPDSKKTQADTTTSSKPAGNKGISVSEPVSPVPQQTADSIWNGDFIERYPNGIVKKRGYIAGGRATGEWFTFYEDGKPWSHGFYENGVRTGLGESWYHSGQKSSEGEYKNGKAVGPWKYWSEEGMLSEKDYGGK
jgi:hypothetical protein